MSKIFELFGYRLDQWTEEAERNRAKAWCPFMDSECDGGGNRQQSAISLSDHPELAQKFPGLSKVQAGVCSLSISEGEQPWIVCPRRLLSLKSTSDNHQEQVRKQVLSSIELPSGSYRVWSEVKMKEGTSNADEEEKYFDYTFDYVIAGSRRVRVSEVNSLVGMTQGAARKHAEANGYSLALRDGEYWIEDFPAAPVVIIEIMTSSTSGGNKKNRSQIAMAFEDSILVGNHSGPGINYRQVWARMVSQLIVKSQVALAWEGKTVWLIQDVLADYITKSTALDLRKFLATKLGEVNILSFGFDSMRKVGGVHPLVSRGVFSGPVSTHGAERGFVDIVKLGAAPSIDSLWRSLFKREVASRVHVD